jgi:5-methylcytosine-specific restriction endonuclease McrA
MALTAKTMREVGPIFWDVVMNDQGKCAYCGLNGSRDIRILGNLHVDHLVPRCANGADDLENLVLSCSRCNVDKGRWDPRKGASKPITRKALVKRAKQYIRTQQSRYLAALYKALNSK